MAHLVAVYKEGEEDYKFLARQIPLIVDDSLKMVLEFSDNVMDFENHKINMSHWKQFYENYSKLKKQDLDISLMVTSIEVHSSLSQLLPCVGCRQSVERLFSDIVESGNPALDPLIVEYIDMHSVNKACLLDARELYTLLYIHGSKLNDVISAIPKSKKNKRCQLHSLDTHKSKPFGGSWMDVWELMSQECRDEVVLIESESLSKTIEIYLRKHRFCSECKNKVMRAYDILVGDLDKSEEKEYCPALYEGLSCCPQENHIHVCCETDFIAHLLFRAEPEFVGGYEHKERHAKTIDIAQEEVLTCLGIHLSERLHMIWQKLQAEVQTWQILFHLGVDTIRRRFEMAVEKMQGISRLEQFVEELSEVERAKVLKQEKKREKRKNWRKKKRGVNMSEEEEAEDKENDLNEIYVESIGGSFEVCGSHDEKTGCDESIITNEGTSFTCTQNTKQGLSPHSNRSDCGYSSSMEGSEMWSRESSDVACSEGICNHDEAGDDANDHHCAGDEDEIDSYVDWWPQSDANNQCKSKKKKRKAKSSCNKQGQTDEALTTCHSSQSLHPCQTKGIFACGDTSANPGLRLPCMVDAKNVGLRGCHQKAYVSLLELQDDSEVTSDAEAFLTQNEIQEFLERNQSFYKQRHHYRVLLKERFDGYCRATKQSCPFLEEWFASTTGVN